MEPHHPTLLGIDVLWVGTLLAGVAAFAVLLAIYAATTVRDPMARRVKALNDRREQLKAGITASTSKRRAKLVQKNETTDRIRSILQNLKVLQDSQVKVAQTKLLQAGIRKKEYAVAVIFGRLILPIVFGLPMLYLVYGTDMFATWSPLKQYGLVAGTFILGYKGPDIYLKNKIQKRSAAIRKGLPDALDLLVICAEAGLTVDTAFHRVSKELGKAYPELGDEFALTAIELGFLSDRRQAFENLATRVDLEEIERTALTYFDPDDTNVASPQREIRSAVTRLAKEGLIEEESEGRFRVTPLVEIALSNERLVELRGWLDEQVRTGSEVA